MEVGDYSPPLPLFNRHLETIFPALFRRVNLPPLERERIVTSDDDFLDIDWLKTGCDRLVIVSHGLEGNSRRAYVLGMLRAFHRHGFDALSWNYRGCGEEMNRQLRFYHSGATDDLGHLVNYCISKGFRQIYLVGFSLGGNLTLKYLGEMGNDLPSEVKGAVTFSVPMNLDTSCDQISRRTNYLYSRRFLKSLKGKILMKAAKMTGLDTSHIRKISTLREFDDFYTAPLHGFADAKTYYRQCSSLYFLSTIAVPTLVVNARNDPFLGPDCFPLSANNHNVILEYPARGGHVGFAQFGQNGLYWSEARALNFIQSIRV
jgi:predicted alpha/beta-fold hydrolase